MSWPSPSESLVYLLMYARSFIYHARNKFVISLRGSGPIVRACVRVCAGFIDPSCSTMRMAERAEDALTL